MNLARRTIAGAVLAAGLFTTVQATAQEQTFYLDRIQISGAPDDGFTVWRQTP